MKNILKYSVSILIAAVLCYWAFKNVDLSSMMSEFTKADPYWVLLAFVLSFFSHYFRAIRWNLMLKPMGYAASKASVCSAIFIGYLTNLVLPRAGEFARAASLQKMEGIPSEKSFGAVVAERIIDVFVLLSLFVLNVALEYRRIADLVTQILGGVARLKSVLFIGFVLMLFTGVLLYRFRKPIFTKLDSVPLISTFLKLLNGFKEGLLSVLKIENIGLFIFYSFLIWFLYFSVTFCILKALPVSQVTTPLVALSVLVIGGVGMAVPSIGGIGSFHLLVSSILHQYNFTATEGITMATFQHSLNAIVFILIFGAIGLLYSVFKSKKDVRH